jgi:hypothetical protein
MKRLCPNFRRRADAEDADTDGPLSQYGEGGRVAPADIEVAELRATVARLRGSGFTGVAPTGTSRR